MNDIPPDPYEALGVSKLANRAEVRSAHRKIILRDYKDYLRDTDSNAAKAEGFYKVQQAYELLGDEAERLRYDNQAKLREMRAKMGAKWVNSDPMSSPVAKSNPFEYEVRTASSIHNEDGQRRRDRSRRRRDEAISARMKLEIEKQKKFATYMESTRRKASPDPEAYQPRPIRRTETFNSLDINSAASYYTSDEEEAPSRPSNLRSRQRIKGDPTAPKYQPTIHFNHLLAGSVSDRPPVREAVSRLNNTANVDSDSHSEYDILRSSASPTPSRRMEVPKPTRYIIDNGRSVPVMARSRYSNSENNVRYTPTYADVRCSAPSPSYEPPRRSSMNASVRPKLTRVTSSASMDDSTRKMYHSMGSDYGGSSDERTYRSRNNNYGSRPSSRDRSQSRNRRHSDAYAPPKEHKFVDVHDILSNPNSKLTHEVVESMTREVIESIQTQRPQAVHLDCPNCLESFDDLREMLRHHEEKHLKSTPATPDVAPDSPSSPETQTQAATGVEASKDAPPADIPGQAEAHDSVSSLTNVGEKVEPSTGPTTPTISGPIHQTPVKKTSALCHPSRFFRCLSKATLHFLGLQTSAWFILVLATAATAITTTYSLQGPAPDPPPLIGDSNYYSSLSQSTVAICSLYYMMVPYLRGDDALPVRGLFYVCWLLGLVGAVACPLIYARDWTKSVWCGFGSSLAQVAASAFLFEHAGKGGKDWERAREKAEMHPKEVSEETKALAKYTDKVEDEE